MPFDAEWWGYSNQHGWVVVNRAVVENQPGSQPMLFVRCSDWSVYQESKTNWNPPKYIYAPRYVSALSTDKARVAKAELAQLKGEFKKRRFELFPSLIIEKKKVIEKHRIFLETIGKQAGAYSHREDNARTRRITHCYNCKDHLDNAVDLECSLCGWIICGECGACGCGYSGA